MDTNSSRSSAPLHHCTHTDQRLTFCFFPCFRKYIKTQSSSSCSILKSSITINITILVPTIISTTHLLFYGPSPSRPSQAHIWASPNLDYRKQLISCTLLVAYKPAGLWLSTTKHISRTRRRPRWRIIKPYKTPRPLTNHKHHVPT